MNRAAQSIDKDILIKKIGSILLIVTDLYFVLTPLAIISVFQKIQQSMVSAEHQWHGGLSSVRSTWQMFRLVGGPTINALKGIQKAIFALQTTLKKVWGSRLLFLLSMFSLFSSSTTTQPDQMVFHFHKLFLTELSDDAASGWSLWFYILAWLNL